MTGALNALRICAVELLREYGVRAVAAMEPERRRKWDEPVVAVSLRRVVCAEGGFQDYLGLRENRESGGSDELYGRAVELTLGLDIYAPGEGGESACQQTMGTVAEALTCRGVGGLQVREIQADRVSFLRQEGLYHLPVSCVCRGWLVAAVDSAGTFADFEVKGRRI